MRVSQRKPRLAGRGSGEIWRDVNPCLHYTTRFVQIQSLPVIVYVRRFSMKLWPSTGMAL
jgi:hypothetical protein